MDDFQEAFNKFFAAVKDKVWLNILSDNLNLIIR
jgi:hypothetical protein